MPMPVPASETGAAQQDTRPGEGDGYRGPATVTIGTSRLRIEVALRGYFEPIDGRYHWYGRAAANEALTAAMSSGRSTVVLTTPEGSAPCELSDPDPWQRYRVTGISTPPFATELTSACGGRGDGASAP